MFKLAFLGALMASTAAYADDTPKILDYGNSYFFSDTSPANRLFIAVKGRMVLTESGFPQTYLLLQPHPREDTWLNNGGVYTDMIKRSGGASTITFIIEPTGSTYSIISRTYEADHEPPNVLHQCVAAPYGVLKTPPAEAGHLTEISGFDQVLNAAKQGGRILASAEYKVGGITVTLDFPVGVLNINPATLKGPVEEGKSWQVASTPIPVYVPLGPDRCHNIRPGRVAFSQHDGTLSFVYACGAEKGKQEYDCTANFPGKVRLFTTAAPS